MKIRRAEQASVKMISVPDILALVESRGDRPNLGRNRGGSTPRWLALQPHSDDAALSVSGVMAWWPGEFGILTMFNQDDIRAREDDQFSQLMGARLESLSLPVSTELRDGAITLVPKEAHDVVARVAEGQELIAPAGVGRHPDHLALSKLAADLGCWLFWEDVAFWGIYGSSVEDRLRFCDATTLELDDMCIVVVAIEPDAKIDALRCYPSQSLDIWRPLRYAASVAREHQQSGFAERLFVHRSALDRLGTLVKAPPREIGAFRYGGVTFESFVITSEPS